MYKKIVELNDKLSESFFAKQINDVDSRYFGGVIDQKTGIPSPSHTGTGSIIGSWVSSYVNSDSRYYHNQQLANRIDHALSYMIKQQHGDGTISPGWTNYHSPPDTGFLVTGFTHIYQLLKKDNCPEAEVLAKKVRTFLERSIPAMLTGGCHTPNHRWVLTSALYHLYSIFRNEELLSRADEWLSEGIDITKDGEWTERSNGIYNSVSDIFLYHTARIRNEPKLLEYVRRNLDMMQYLVHPDGEVVTDYSGRQDFGNAHHLSQYHLIYRLMTFHDNNPLYAAMSDLAAKNLSEMGPVNNHIMIGYLMFPFLKERFNDKTTLPTKYEIVINGDFPVARNLKKMPLIGHGSKIEHSSMHESFGAPIVRYRQNEESATIMCKNTSFFSLRKGQVKLLGIRVYSSFSPGVIEFDKLKNSNGSYRLMKRMEKGYKGPIPKEYLTDIAEESIWYLLPHQYRKLTHNQTFIIEIHINKTNNDEWNIHVKSDEREDVFLQMEFLFSNDGLIQGNEVTKINEKTYFWKSDELIYYFGTNYMTISAGAHEHWMESIGVDQGGSNVQAVKVNLLSPVDKNFTIKLN